MDTALPPLDPEDREVLSHFVRLVDDMSRSRFIQRCRTQDHTISCNPTDEGPGITAPEYDGEDFDAFLSRFRQVALNKRDSVYVFKVLGIAGKYASADLRKQLRPCRKHLTALLEQRHEGMRFCGQSPSGQEISLSSQETLDAIVNGLSFHPGAEHRETIRFLDTAARWQYLWPLLTEIIEPALNDFYWLYHALRRDGILADEDYPERCRPARPA